MNNVKWLSTLILVCVLIGLIGCSPKVEALPTSVPAPAATVAPATNAPAPAATAAPEKKTRIVTDTTGKKVEIPLEVNRIVVIKGGCNIPGILTALGSGDKLVSGLCFKGGPEDIQLKIQPSYKDISVIAPGENGVDVEQLLTLKPDLVIVWTNVSNADKIAQAGIPVMVMDISTWENVRSVFTMLGEVTNKQERAAKIVAAIDQMAKNIQDKVSAIPEDQKKKVMLVSNTKPITVLGGTSHNNFMIEMTGGIPAMKDVPGHFVNVDMEKILKADPDIILISAASKQSLNEILQSSEWQALRAVKNKKVYVAPRGVFFWDKPNAETPLFLLWETYIQYPDLVSEDDVIKETKQYYHDIFNYDLTDEDIKTIFYK